MRVPSWQFHIILSIIYFSYYQISGSSTHYQSYQPQSYIFALLMLFHQIFITLKANLSSLPYFLHMTRLLFRQNLTFLSSFKNSENILVTLRIF